MQSALTEAQLTQRQNYHSAKARFPDYKGCFTLESLCCTPYISLSPLKFSLQQTGELSSHKLSTWFYRNMAIHIHLTEQTKFILCMSMLLSNHFNALPKLCSKINNHMKRFLLLLLCQTLTLLHYFSVTLFNIYSVYSLP